MLALSFGAFFCLDGTTQAAPTPSGSPLPASSTSSLRTPRLPPLRPGAPMPWEHPGSDLWNDEDSVAFSAGGNLRQSFPLFRWWPPGLGPAIDVGLVQNSADVDVEGPLGRGLRLGVAATLRVDGAGVVTIEEADGTARAFQRPPQGGPYVGARFDFDRLERTDVSRWTLRCGGGLARIFTEGKTGKFLETSRRDRVGDAVTLAYDAGDRLTTITDSAGRTATFRLNGAVYDAIVDPEGHTFSLLYETDSLIQVTGPATDTGAKLTMNLYWDDAPRRLRGRSTWSGGPGAVFTYDATNRVTSIRRFDSGEASEISYGDGTLTVREGSGTSLWEYDDGALAARVDPQGRRSLFSRDANKRVIAATDPAGRTTRYEYNDADDVTAVVDPAGGRMESVYDQRHRVVTATDPFGQVSKATYNDFDEVLTQTNALGETTSYTYDNRGNMVLARDFVGVRRLAVTYSALGHPLTETDALGRVTTTTYDGKGSWLSVRGPDGATTSRTVSLLGRTLSTTNALGEKKTIGYDALARAVSSTEEPSSTGAPGGSVRVARDVEGRVVSFDDSTGPVAQGRAFTWAPDRYLATSSVNGRPVRTAPPRSR